MRKTTTLLALVAAALLSAPVVAQPASFLDLGVVGGAGTYTFDTIGSFNVTGGFDLDTELGLWDMDGTLLDADDDGAGFPFSQITADLGPGMYFLGISEFNSIFEDGFVNSGTGFEAGEIGDTVLNINGAFAGAQQAGGDGTGLDQTAFYKVTVVPEPACAAVLLPCALVLVRRRSR